MIKKTIKAAIVKDTQLHATDTGSVEVQVTLLTQRITELTEHLKVHKKDLSSRMGLMKIVGERRKLLTYLKRTSLMRYEALTKRLSLKK
jgi:small subunit ribosomal protein S15